MYSYTITIGRGSLGTPDELPLNAWREFKESVRAIWLPFVSTDEVVEDHEGMGRWKRNSERSYKTTLLTHKPLSSTDLVHVRAMLAIQRDRFGQDAIALTIGESELV